ncbi:MAG: LON peptidase substrate-binding domain-containing protein [Candidatus Melainabacteria bacterium]|nr:LON peptidase substrate-binding domain-containing protein [Candidatus Melainabacteria bacterium]
MTATRRPHSPRLPIIPLPNVVLYPHMPLTLCLSEPRYCQLLQTCVERQEPFGVVLCKTYDPVSLQGEPFEVGTLLVLERWTPMENRHWLVHGYGGKRFRLMETNEAARPSKGRSSAAADEERPVLQATVSWLQDRSDEPAGFTPAQCAALGALFLEVLRLSQRVCQYPETLPEGLPTEPETLSYLIAHYLRGSLVLKQQLLALDSTHARLSREWDALRQMREPLLARAQIEDVFGPDLP